MATETRLRYEVWASIDGSVAKWKIVPQGIYVGEAEHNESNKCRALDRADILSIDYAKTCVEEWDAGRNVYLRTVREFPLK